MSQLIRTQKAMTSTPRSMTTPRPTTTPTGTAATTSAEMYHRPVNSVDPFGPPDPQVHASSTSSVALPVSAQRAHGNPSDQMSPSGSTTDASGTQLAKKNIQGPCQQLKMVKVTWVTNGRMTIGFDERHRVAPTMEQHSALVHNIGHVMLTFCPMRWKSWKAMPEEANNTVRN